MRQCPFGDDLYERIRLDHDDFARADGFKDYDDMMGWFEKTHGLPFYGWLIAW